MYYVDIYVSTEHVFRAAQVQYKEMWCKQSAGTEVIFRNHLFFLISDCSCVMPTSSYQIKTKHQPIDC